MLTKLDIFFVNTRHFTQKNRLKWRFFCVFCSIFVSWTIAVQRRFQGQKSGGSMSEDSR